MAHKFLFAKSLLFLLSVHMNSITLHCEVAVVCAIPVY